MLLKGKFALITGVANGRSIAWGIAKAFYREGAELAFTYRRDRSGENLRELLNQLDSQQRFIVRRCDLEDDISIQGTIDELAHRWGALHIVVHSVASADRMDLRPDFTQISRSGFALAQSASVVSLVALAQHTRALIESSGGGSIVAITYDAVNRVVPPYGVMAPAKAALETVVRYLAADLGPVAIRVNAISAGPVKTLAASGVRGISGLKKIAEASAPLRRNITTDDIGDVAVFPASNLSRSVTGSIIAVDNGLHLMSPLATH